MTDDAENLPLSPHQPVPVRCGTTAGARAHRRAGEKLCELCLAANAEYLREYRLRRSVRENPDGELAKARETLAKAQAHLARVEEIIRDYTPDIAPAVPLETPSAQPFMQPDELTLPTFLTSP